MKINMSELIDSCGVKFGTSGARGLVEQMSGRVCYAYAAAFWQAVGSGVQVVVGHDLRPSSPDMARACIRAFNDLGVEVIYAGALPTPALAYYAQTLGVPALIVTGSHIPFDRNGIKFYRADGEISKEDEQAMLQAQLTLPEMVDLPVLPAIVGQARQAYISRYMDFFGVDSLCGRKVAVYQHSSVARDLLVEVFEQLGADVLALGRTDTFVPIDTEAVRAEDIAQAKEWAAQYDFDMLVSTDGDADRPLIGDEQGNWLRGDVVGVLCAQFLRADTVVTPVSSNTVLEKSAQFSKVLRTRIGSPYVIAAMQRQSGVVAGYEANGGVLLGSAVARDDIVLSALPTRDALLPMLALLELAQQKQCRVSALTETLPARYTHSDRLQAFATEKSQQLLSDLQENPVQLTEWLAPGQGEVVNVDRTDGLRVTFFSGVIVHLRPSGNAPELRCYAEADSAEQARQLCNDCLARVRQC